MRPSGAHLRLASILLGGTAFLAPVQAGTCHDGAAAQSRGWVLRKLAHVQTGSNPVLSAYTRFELNDVEADIRRVLRKYGPNAELLTGLGRALAFQGKYAAASDAYAEALELSPRSAPLRRQLKSAKQLAGIAVAARPWLRKGSKVLRIEPLGRRGGRAYWAMLSAEPEHRDRPSSFFREQVSLLAASGAGLQRTWVSPTKPGDDSGDEGEHDFLEMHVGRFTGRRAPEIALLTAERGGGWSKSHIKLFEWRGAKLRSFWGASSAQGVFIQDLDHDGRAEITIGYQIGNEMPHMGQPGWKDVYAWDGYRYWMANERFPKAFRELEPDIRDVHRAFPNDPQILEFLGVLHQIHGRRAAARAAYQRAAALARQAGAEADLREIKYRLRVLNHPREALRVPFPADIPSAY